jgi:hypothetical protein
VSRRQQRGAAQRAVDDFDCAAYVAKMLSELAPHYQPALRRVGGGGGVASDVLTADMVALVRGVCT